MKSDVYLNVRYDNVYNTDCVFTHRALEKRLSDKIRQLWILECHYLSQVDQQLTLKTWCMPTSLKLTKEKNHQDLAV